MSSCIVNDKVIADIYFREHTVDCKFITVFTERSHNIVLVTAGNIFLAGYRNVMICFIYCRAHKIACTRINSDIFLVCVFFMDIRIQRLNWVTRGWINYFRIGKMKGNMTKIDEHLRTRMRIVIWKQWKTGQKRMWGLRKLGAPEWMARQSAGFADHYQAVAKTTGLRLINKQILAKRGLVSCLDYYLD